MSMVLLIDSTMSKVLAKMHRVRSLFLAMVMLPAFSTSTGLNTCEQHVEVCSLVEELKARVYSILALGGPCQHEELDGAVNEVFNFKEMARFILGTHWKAATSEQRQRFTENYEQHIRNLYVMQLKRHANHKMKIMSVRRKGGDFYSLRVRLMNPEQRDDFVILEFHVTRSDSGLKIDDIKFNNSVSIAISQRSVVDSLIQKRGIEGAIERFAKTTPSFERCSELSARHGDEQRQAADESK
ncbi:phospholipid transport system substrate-binding protein [Anaplasma platys]|uniref:Phospholipid transport system substrate-binding protein n=1 Tax=Anaplasma platys TaxID=949 RepID=A0A858PZD2_9RICK|nr:ABC transporter substrate-binding protein [Anaplasma platys]QJC27976.1 phospholipid transport system substrate-binding protein [Anaplasma platys]